MKFWSGTWPFINLFPIEPSNNIYFLSFLFFLIFIISSMIPGAVRDQCISPLYCELEPCSRRCVLDTTLCVKVCQWISPGSQVSSTNKTDRHDITEILLKVVLNTINQPTKPSMIPPSVFEIKNSKTITPP